MYCKYCGKRIEDDSSVCRFCGKEQEGSGGVRIDMGNIAQYAGAGAGVGNVNMGTGNTIRKNTTKIDKSTNVDNRGGLIQRSTIGSGEGRIDICPYCGKELDFPKPPSFCPHCGEHLK